MGLLDDAIREHLDLKRRRGADPTEIEQAEREALGPVRRGPEVTGEEPAEPEPLVEPEAGYAPADQEQWEPFHEDPEMQMLEEHEDQPPYESARGAGGDALLDDEHFSGEQHEPVHGYHDDLAAAPDSEPLPVPHPADPAPAPPHHEGPSRHVDQETEEYELEPEGDDDVLESTPEFLQDAPEHDRLWFEQRPPRDFDFDG